MHCSIQLCSRALLDTALLVVVFTSHHIIAPNSTPSVFIRQTHFPMWSGLYRI